MNIICNEYELNLIIRNQVLIKTNEIGIRTRAICKSLHKIHFLSKFQKNLRGYK